MSGFGNIGPFSSEELNTRRDHIEKLIGKDVQLSEREIAVANEAFITGRVYTQLGEKESPEEIQEKLIQNCRRAVKGY